VGPVLDRTSLGLGSFVYVGEPCGFIGRAHDDQVESCWLGTLLLCRRNRLNDGARVLSRERGGNIIAFFSPAAPGEKNRASADLFSLERQIRCDYVE
jgi:hypothetical protein